MKYAERKTGITNRKKEKMNNQRGWETRTMLLQEAVGKVVTVKLLNGKLISCQGNNRFNLENVVFTSQDGNVSQLAQTSFRASQVIFVDIPEMLEIIQFIVKSKPQHNNPSDNMILVKCDDNHFVKLKETVAVQMHILKDLMGANTEDNPIYCIPGITSKTLCMVIKYCEDKIMPYSFENGFDVRLINLIQAAHHLKVKSLVDVACEALKEKVEALKEQEAYQRKVKDFLQPQKRLTKARSLEAVMMPFVAQRGTVKSSNILRSHGRETFIRQLDLEDVCCSAFVSDSLLLRNKKSDIVARVEVLTKFSENLRPIRSMKYSDFVKLKNSVEYLESLFNGEPRLADHLSGSDVHSLVLILDSIDCIPIKMSCVPILSHVRFDKWSDLMEREALPLLVRLMNSKHDLLVQVLIALARLAYAYPDCIQVILEKGALEAAHKISSNHAVGTEVIINLAKFLAAVCRGVILTSDESSNIKINTILNILKELFEKRRGNSYLIARTCYALSYLSYERSVPIKAAELKRLTTLFVDDEISVAGSAFGVIANIARWGSDDQIKLLAEQHKLMEGLGLKWLCCEFKMFQKGACQIISNMAARSITFREDMHKLIDPLLKLLKEDGNKSDVKMEAAWSLFNRSAEYDVDMIDKYDNDNLMVAAVLHLKNKSFYTTLMNVARTCGP